jgi:ribosome-associated protein YbcJ (S4-like RNA binding protein)
MTFQAQMQSDMAAVLFGNDEFEETLLYYAAGADEGKSIKGIIERNPVMDGVFVDGEFETRTARITISMDNQIGIAEPALGDKATFDALDWFVADVKTSPNEQVAILTLKIVEAVQKGAQAHFIRR